MFVYVLSSISFLFTLYYTRPSNAFNVLFVFRLYFVSRALPSLRFAHYYVYHQQPTTLQNTLMYLGPQDIMCLCASSRLLRKKKPAESIVYDLEAGIVQEIKSKRKPNKIGLTERNTLFSKYRVHVVQFVRFISMFAGSSRPQQTSFVKIHQLLNLFQAHYHIL